jgi:nicotinate-nucleotide pyrophosphorylase (carboxylating)
VAFLSLDDLVRRALFEDVGGGDVTTDSIIDLDARCSARLVAKESGVLSGIPAFRAVFDALPTAITEWQSANDGDRFAKGDTVALFEGNTRCVLTGERVALNFVQRLSGVSTMTDQFMQAVKGINVRICDTRKTTPFLREMEKQAVRHGGGNNHRYALFDGVLIKDNHIAAAGGITAAVKDARMRAHHLLRVEVEVTTLEQLDEALAVGVEAVLLDNMDLDTLRASVECAKEHDVLLEASGNVNLETVRSVAEVGVDIISIGALTHSARAIDLSLLVDEVL